MRYTTSIHQLDPKHHDINISFKLTSDYKSLWGEPERVHRDEYRG